MSTGNVSSLWRRCLLGVVACLVLASWSGATEVRSASEAEREYILKAGFIYNFAQFVTWPATTFRDRNAPFVICVLGEDPFGGALDDAVAAGDVGGREIAVRRLDWEQELEQCQILFVAESEKSRQAALLDRVSARPILTISDLGGFAERGGAIGFRTESNRLRFDVNVTTTREAGLTASSQMLQLARVVEQ